MRAVLCQFFNRERTRKEKRIQKGRRNEGKLVNLPFFPLLLSLLFLSSSDIVCFDKVPIIFCLWFWIQHHIIQLTTVRCKFGSKTRCVRARESNSSSSSLRSQIWLIRKVSKLRVIVICSFASFHQPLDRQPIIRLHCKECEPSPPRATSLMLASRKESNRRSNLLMS